MAVMQNKFNIWLSFPIMWPFETVSIGEREIPPPLYLAIVLELLLLLFWGKFWGKFWV